MKIYQRNCLLCLFLLTIAVCIGANTDREARQLADLLHLGPGSSVADLGAGNGEFSVALAAIVGAEGKVVATEVDESKVEKIEKLIRRKDLKNVETVLGTQDSTGLQPDSVDAILIRLVYHHFADPQKMHWDLKKALRPGGRIAIVDFGPENNFPRSSVPKFRNGHGIVAETLIEEMRTAGFKLEERRDQWADDKRHYLLVFSLGEDSP